MGRQTDLVLDASLPKHKNYILYDINFIVWITKFNKVVQKPHRKGNVLVHRSFCRYVLVS